MIVYVYNANSYTPGFPYRGPVPPPKNCIHCLHTFEGSPHELLGQSYDLDAFEPETLFSLMAARSIRNALLTKLEHDALYNP